MCNTAEVAVFMAGDLERAAAEHMDFVACETVDCAELWLDCRLGLI